MVGVCEAARPPTMRAMSVLPLTVDRRDDGASAWQTLVGATLPESIRFDILRPLRCQSETSSQYAAGGRRARCFRVDLSSGLLIGPDQTPPSCSPSACRLVAGTLSSSHYLLVERGG